MTRQPHGAEGAAGDSSQCPPVVMRRGYPGGAELVLGRRVERGRDCVERNPQRAGVGRERSGEESPREPVALSAYCFRLAASTLSRFPRATFSSSLLKP